MLSRCLSVVFLLSVLVIFGSLYAFADAPSPADLPRSVYGGVWNTRHLQGFAIDDAREYMYFSFTTMLVKTDMEGNVVGTVVGLTGHLGDLAFYDGKVYGSLEYKDRDSFYIAVFDAEKITRENMPHNKDGVMTTMYLAEVAKDYTDKLDAGEYYNTPSSMGHRYGCSGIDGIAFGTVPGSADGKIKLMVAYGIYSNTNRTDNDYQVILQYDPDPFVEENQDILDQTHHHKKGPAHEAKYFVYTGNTNYGVQNLEYDQDTGDYWMAVYVGGKPSFPNYPLYKIDGKVAPRLGPIVGQKDPDEQGLLLTLAKEGRYHEETGIWGIVNTGGNATTGFISLGEGYFYISTSGGNNDGQYGYANLYKYDSERFRFSRVPKSRSLD